MTAKVLVVGLVLLCATSARSENVRAAVDAGNRAFVKAFLRGDARTVSQLYTENAEVIAPGAPVARGRAAIQAAWQQAIDSGIKDVRLTTDDVTSSGDLACETGTVRLVGKDDAANEARYVVVWKRTRAGWKLHRDIWNSSK